MKISTLNLMAILTAVGVGSNAFDLVEAKDVVSSSKLDAVEHNHMTKLGSENSCGKGSCGKDEAGAKAAQEKQNKDKKSTKKTKKAKGVEGVEKKPESK